MISKYDCQVLLHQGLKSTEDVGIKAVEGGKLKGKYPSLVNRQRVLLQRDNAEPHI